MMYLEFTVLQTMEHFLACHEHAFAALGVPEKIMVDNLKSAVLRRLVGIAPVLNPRYVDFARHHGFKIAPCNIRAGWEKGRVESGVGYVKKNMLNGMELPDFSAMNTAAQIWLSEIANVRIHAETHQRPVDLRVLPAEMRDRRRWRSVALGPRPFRATGATHEQNRGRSAGGFGPAATAAG